MNLLEAIINNKNVTDSTMKNLISLKNFISEFLKEEFKRKDMPLKNIDQVFWKKFQEYSLKKGNSHNYIITQVRNLSAMVKRNQDYILIPLPKKIVSSSKPKHNFLIDDQLEQIKQLKSNQTVKDWFLFQCYTGMAFDDLKRIGKKSIIQSEDGLLLEYVRGKTEKKSGTPCRQPIIDEALDILARYDYHFEIPYSTYSDGLKRIGKELGFNITSHMARHTFGTNKTQEGWPIEQLKVMMAHSSIATTQRYAFANNKALFETKKRLENK